MHGASSVVCEQRQTLPLLSRNTGYPVSAQDGYLHTDDDKPKYIEEVYYMNIGALYRMFKNLKSSTLVTVTNINVQDDDPFTAEVFSGPFMKMPLSVFKLRVVDFTLIEEFDELCVNVDL